MKLVIEIDDKTYRTIKDGLFLIKGGRGSGRIMEYNALKSIYDGTPLPKGHGDLIDRKELLKQPIDNVFYPSNYVRTAPPIIEADKESTEPHECNTCKFGKNYENGYDATTMNDECGGCCSWNDKWQPKESEGKE